MVVVVVHVVVVGKRQANFHVGNFTLLVAVFIVVVVIKRKAHFDVGNFTLLVVVVVLFFSSAF